MYMHLVQKELDSQIYKILAKSFTYLTFMLLVHVL